MPKQSERVLSTDRQIASVRAHGVRATFRIAGVSNLVLRVTPAGAKSWGYWFRDLKTHRWRMVTIGRYPALSLARAKQEALRIAVARADGEDPFSREQPLRLSALADRFIERHSKVKKRSWPDDVRKLKVEVLPILGDHLAAEISKGEIVRLLDGISDRGAGVLANRTLALVRKLFNWAVAEGYVAENPARGVPLRAKEVPRERTLSASEIAVFWRSLDGDAFDSVTADVLRLQLLLGARVREITGMQRDELDLDGPVPLWILPKGRAKGGRDIPRPLASTSFSIIQRRIARNGATPNVFESPSVGGQSISAAAPSRAVQRAAERGLCPSGFTPHDLRRTMATGLAGLGVTETVAKKILGHAPRRSDVLGFVYNRHAYIDEMTAALEAWERHVLALVDTYAGNGVR